MALYNSKPTNEEKNKNSYNGGDKPTTVNDKGKILINDQGSQSLEAYIAALESNEQELHKLREKYIENEVQKQKNLKQQALNDMAAYEAQIREATGNKNFTLSKEQQKKLTNEYYKEKVKKDIEVQKKAGILKTKDTKKQDKANLAKNAKDNAQLYKDLDALQKSGVELTEEQLKVKDQAKKDAQEGWKEEQLQKIKKGLGLNDLNETMKNLGNIINTGISTYSKYQTSIDARLQGFRGNDGDLWASIEKKLTNSVGVTPYFKNETMLNNLQSLVAEGIASNIEQRAFLQTAKDSIATTFDAANSSLLRIIRLQQNDSTAARLGMEAYLTRYLNNLVENTEYLQNTFDTVESALLEASSQMSTAESTEFEYIVQKWLGALTGTGLSETTATSIAQAIGYIGSGDINSLNSSNVQNLMVMAASKAGLNYSDLLTNGLNAYNTNQLMSAMASYMAELSQNSNNVAKSQLASTFGITISDLTAASQLQDSFQTITNNMMSYTGMYEELNYQMGKIVERTSISEMITNVADNAKFSLASNIASNPALSALWQITDLIQGVTGGINVPYISAFGNGFDLNTTIENLMKLGIVGVGSFGMIGDIISGIGNTANPSNILDKLGITSESESNAIVRGSGLSARSAGMSTSVSTYVGNNSSSDIYNSTLNAANDSANQELDQKVEESDDPTKHIDEYLSNNLETYLNESRLINEKLRDTTTSTLAYLTTNLETSINDIKTYLISTLEPHVTKLDTNSDTVVDKLSSTIPVEVQDYGLIGINN